MTTTMTAEQVYQEFTVVRNWTDSPSGWRNPSPAEQKRRNLAVSTWDYYASLHEGEVLDLLDAGEKATAQRQDRLFEVRERVKKNLKQSLTIKKAIVAMGKGEPEAMRELLAIEEYRRLIAAFEDTPGPLLERFIAELYAEGAERHRNDIFQSVAANPSLFHHELDLLIAKARYEEDYALLINHPRLSSAQFGRIAVKNPTAALLREAGLAIRYLEPYRFHESNKVEALEPIAVSDDLMRRILRAAAKSHAVHARLWVMLDSRSPIDAKRTALRLSLPRRVKEADGTRRWLSGLHELLGALTPERIARLDPNVRAMLVLYPRTPMYVLRNLEAAGVTRDVVLYGSQFPARGVDYRAYFATGAQAA